MYAGSRCGKLLARLHAAVHRGLQSAGRGWDFSRANTERDFGQRLSTVFGKSHSRFSFVYKASVSVLMAYFYGGCCSPGRSVTLFRKRKLWLQSSMIELIGSSRATNMLFEDDVVGSV